MVISKLDTVIPLRRYGAILEVIQRLQAIN